MIMTMEVICMCVLRKINFRRKSICGNQTSKCYSLKVFLSVDHLENLSHPQKYLDPSSKTADSVHLK